MEKSDQSEFGELTADQTAPCKRRSRRGLCCDWKRRQLRYASDWQKSRHREAKHIQRFRFNRISQFLNRPERARGDGPTT